MPQRTASDELFSISVQDVNLDDIFQDFLPAMWHSQDMITLPPAKKPIEDSATESESDEETMLVGRDCTPRPPHRHQSVPLPFVPSSQNASQHPISTMESQREIFPEHDITQESMSSYISLPGAVKEFQNMFGQGTQSYPEDFPMSLRE